MNKYVYGACLSLLGVAVASGCSASNPSEIVSDIDGGAVTPAVDSGAVTPAVDSGAVTPAVDSGAVTPAVDSGAVTPAVDSGAVTPAVDSGAVTPVCTTSTYENFAQTFFARNCNGCHAAQRPTLGTKAAIVANLANVTSAVRADRMPKFGRLSPADKAKVLEWLDCGAP